MRIITAIFTCLAATLAAQAGSITVTNASFESATLPFGAGNGSYNQLIPGSTINPPVTGGTLTGWTATSNSVNSAAGAYAPNAGGVNWTTPWWSGNEVAYLQESGSGVTTSLSQVLGDTLQDDTLYTLSSLVGCRTAGFFCADSIQLYAGTMLVASASNLSLPENSFGSDSAVYSSGPSDPHAGEVLSIVLSSTAVPGTNSRTYTEAFFDSVTLTAESDVPPAPAPEPRTFALLGLGVVVLLFARRVKTGAARRPA